VVESAETWSEIRKGGINGFYNVVASLGWWLQATKTDQEVAEFNAMLKDVLWVSEQMIQYSPSMKRPFDNDDASDKMTSKR
jgi:hypothetical protein